MIVLDHAFTPATRQYYTPCVYKRWITIYALKLNMNQYSELLHLIVIEHALFIESSERRYHVSEYPLIAVHRANMGPIWGRQDPGGPNVGPMNFAIWVMLADNLAPERTQTW